MLHTHTHTHHGLVAVCPPVLQEIVAVCEWCELPVREPCCNLRSEQGWLSNGWRYVGLLDGGRVIRRVKTEGRNSYLGGVVICSTVSRPSSRRARKPVERCCSCTWHSTCSTAGPSARAYGFCNDGRQWTGCYCWVPCKNRGQLMPSPTMARGLLGHFPRGADPLASNQCVAPLPF